MKNLKVELTIATGKQYENVHLSEEVETLDEAMEFMEKVEQKGFHNHSITNDMVENAGGEELTDKREVKELPIKK